MNCAEKDDGGPKFKAYKLLVDPWLIKGASNVKLYRFDGVVPDDPTYPPVICRDPRTTLSLSRSWNRPEVLELPMPRFRIDEHYRGTPPPIEVSITNLNDNVDRTFLCDLLHKFGRADEVEIYYHPITNKHLGIARILFENKAASKACVAKLNNSPLMGNILSVFFDPFYLNIKQLFKELTREKKVEPPPVTPKKVEDKKSDEKGKHGGHGKHRSSHGHGHSASRTPLPPPAPSISSSSNDTPSAPPGHHAPSVPPSVTASKYAPPSAPPLIPYSRNSFPVDAAPPPPHDAGSQSRVFDVDSQERLSKPVESQSCDTQGDECDDGESPKMDLDTRIKLLLKSSKSTPFGKFLNFSMSDSEDEEGEPRGRFRGGFTIRKRKSLCISRSEIWQSENSDNEASPPRQKARRNSGDSPPPSPFLDHGKKGGWKPINGLVQELHLSDLDQVSEDSEIELPSEKKESRGQVPPEATVGPGMLHPPNTSQPHPSTYDPQVLNQFYSTSAEAYAQQMTFGLYPPNYPVYQQPPPPPPIPPWATNPPTTQFDYSQMTYDQSYASHHQFEPPPPPPPEVPPLSPTTLLRESTTEISMSVLERLTKDLRLILQRDCEKRLIEALSFKLFESWCDEQVKVYKELKEQRDRENKKAAEERLNGKLEMTITEDNLTGFGFRSTTKLPSFKIQKKVVAPPVVPVKAEEPVPLSPPPEEPEDEEPEDEEEEEESDGEIEIKRRPTRRLTLLSSESDLGDYSSEEDIPAKNKNKVEEKHKKKASKEAWAERVSEESSSPKPPTKSEAVPGKRAYEFSEDEEEIRQRQQDELLEKKIAAFEQVLRSPLRPSSPPRVSMEGPYIHTYDHNYTKPWKPSEEPKPTKVLDDSLALFATERAVKAVSPKAKPLKASRAKVESRRSPPKPTKRIVSFEQRDKEEERRILTEFLISGIDQEDLLYFRNCFENMNKDPAQAWTTRTHWSDHPPTKLLERKRKSKRRVHVTGSARTEGFYHLDAEEKRRHKMQWATVQSVEYSAPGTVGAVGVTALAHEKHQGKTQIEKSREARSQQRRILTALGNEVTSTSDLLKFNQLKFRKKNLCFRRSTIHDWGLFAAEPIAADEMVIEYVGQTIRPYLADVREQKYEKQGIGSSYLFRIDLENIIDATKCGNLSRFINHSCNPNCYAKVITIQGEKKIVIYSKEAIALNDEITYDYKFPIEEKKIICLCGTPQCRGTLN